MVWWRFARNDGFDYIYLTGYFFGLSCDCLKLEVSTVVAVVLFPLTATLGAVAAEATPVQVVVSPLLTPAVLLPCTAFRAACAP